MERHNNKMNNSIYVAIVSAFRHALGTTVRGSLKGSLRGTLGSVVVALAMSAPAVPTAAAQEAPSMPRGALVRIAVDSTGMQQLTAADLQRMGFDDIERVRVWGYGGVLPADHRLTDAYPVGLPEQPSVVIDGKLLFYGEAGERLQWNARWDTMGVAHDDTTCSRLYNQSSRAGYYYIGYGDGERLTPPVTDTALATGTTVTTHHAIDWRKGGDNNPLQGGTALMGPNVVRGGSGVVNILFEPRSLVAGSSLWFTQTVGVKASQIKVVTRINPLTSTTDIVSTASPNNSDRDEAIHYTLTTKTNGVVEQGPTYDYRIDFNRCSEAVYGAVEHVALLYVRHNRLEDQPQMTMHYRALAPGTAVAVTDTPGALLWDVTDPLMPTVLAGGVTAGPGAPGGEQRIVAFDPSRQQYTPRQVSAVAPLDDITAMEVPQVLVVAPGAMKEAAESLAALHREALGLDSRAVTTRQVWDAWSSGTPSVDGLRRMIASLVERGEGRLTHVVLMGASTWDFRGTQSDIEYNIDNRLPTYHTEVASHQGWDDRCYASDAFYGILRRGDDVPDLSLLMRGNMAVNIGRIPASHPVQAMWYVNKYASWLASRGDTHRDGRALLVADRGNANGHCNQMEVIARRIQSAAPDFHINKAYCGTIAGSVDDHILHRRAVAQAMNDGLTYMAYAGHSQYILLGDFLTAGEAAAMANPPVECVMLSTCYSSPIDRDIEGVGPLLVLNPRGGAMAVVGSGRSVVMSWNQYLNLGMADNYFAAATAALAGGDAVTPGSQGDDPSGESAASTATAGGPAALGGYMSVGDLFRLTRDNTGTYANSSLTTNTSCYNLLGDPTVPCTVYNRMMTICGGEQDNATPATLQFKGGGRYTLQGTVTRPDGTVDCNFNGQARITLWNPMDSCKILPNKVDDAIVSYEAYPRAIVSAEGTVKDGLVNIELTVPAASHAGREGLTATVAAATADGSLRALVADIPVAIDTALPSSSGTPPAITAMAVCSVDGSVDNVGSFDMGGFDNMGSFHNVGADGGVIRGQAMLHATIQEGGAPLQPVASIECPTAVKVDGHAVKSPHAYITANGDGTYTMQCPLGNLDDGVHTVDLTVSDTAGDTDSRTATFTVVNRAPRVTLECEEAVARTVATLAVSHEYDSEPQWRLTVSDRRGNVVWSVSDPALPCRWPLTDVDGHRVPDGEYTVTLYGAHDREGYAVARCTVRVIE